MKIQERCGLCGKKKKNMNRVQVTYISGGEARRYEIPKLLCSQCEKFTKKKMPEFFLKAHFDGLISIPLNQISKEGHNHEA